MSALPPDYTKPPPWMNDFLGSFYAELRPLIERAHSAVVEEARRRNEADPALVGVMAVIGMSCQSNLLLLAKGIARAQATGNPDPYQVVATNLSLDVHNSTLATFAMMVSALIEARGATQQ